LSRNPHIGTSGLSPLSRTWRISDSAAVRSSIRPSGRSRAASPRNTAEAAAAELAAADAGNAGGDLGWAAEGARAAASSDAVWTALRLRLAAGADDDAAAAADARGGDRADRGTLRDACAMCAGVLPFASSRAAADAVEARLAVAAYEDAPSYSLALSLPVWLDVRARVLLHWAAARRGAHAAAPAADPVPLKTLVRERLAACLGLRARARPDRYPNLARVPCVPPLHRVPAGEEGLQVLLSFTLASSALGFPAMLDRTVLANAANAPPQPGACGAAERPAGGGGAAAEEEEGRSVEPVAAARISGTQIKRMLREAPPGASREIASQRILLDVARSLHRRDVGPLVAKLDDAALSALVPLPLPPITGAAAFSVTSLRSSTYVAGRYNKYCRDYLQTPMLRNGRPVSPGTVMESLLAPLRERLPGDDYRFYSSGREDQDVRMLGRGRPFYVEVVNPRRLQLSDAEFAAVESEVRERSGGRVAVRDLQVVTRSDTRHFKEGESQKRKSYTSLVWLSRPLDAADLARLEAALTELTITQRTPIRVMHRRALIARPRVIHSGRLIPLTGDACTASAASAGGAWSAPRAGQLLELRLQTQAGTYIKEFVHGDLGRTTPSLGPLVGPGVVAEILQLDVDEVHLDFPPSVLR
jgi:tRNA pseudouridine(54/55) synthase